MFLNLAAESGHSLPLRVLAWLTSQLTQFTASGCLSSTYCWLPICRAFFGLAMRITANDAPNDKVLGTTTCSAVSESNSPGLSKPKKRNQYQRSESEPHSSLFSSVFLHSHQVAFADHGSKQCQRERWPKRVGFLLFPRFQRAPTGLEGFA